MTPQPAILAAVPPHAVFLFLDRAAGVAPGEALAALAAAPHPDHLVAGVGPALVAALGAQIPGLRGMPELVGPGVAIPSTPSELFLRVSGADPGEVLHRERAVLARLPAFRVTERVAGFVHDHGHDLTGFEDGTENPEGDDVPRVALRSGEGPGLDGGSLVAVQRWAHDLDAFEALTPAQQNDSIGRDRQTNEEDPDAPATAHVKRTAQESFEPEAFVWRRSMPWRDARGAGLVFVSFSASLDPFEAQLRRMAGAQDGLVDGLFAYTRPVTGATFFCPPLREGRLDLRALRG